MWAELHARAIEYTGDRAAEEQWLAAFRGRIGCGACREHWDELLRRMPPDISGPIAYWVWTFRAHNAVNRFLGRTPLDFGEALRRFAAALQALSEPLIVPAPDATHRVTMQLP
jgi:hypothetical protein